MLKRRQFVLSGTATAALALAGCGGGGGEAEAQSAGSGPLAAIKRTKTSSGSTSGTTSGTTSGSTTTPTTTTTTTNTNTATTAAIAYPFGARLVAYRAGIKPSQSNATMDTMLAAQYDAWKAARVVSASSIVAGGYAVKFSDANYMTVSEGMGYGMLLAVVFAGHDPQARAIFDGMLAVVRARYAYAIVPYDANGKYLMDWRIAANGASAGDGWNAMDGDLDIAMALLMADKQWGSAGAWNYKQEALNTIAALKSWNMKSDGTTKGLANANVSRTSDYMIGHFRAFKAATGDTLWDTAVDRSYWLIDRMQTVYSSAGLMPDFIVATDTSTPYPSPGFMGDGNANENRYWWNACRNPWRYATDYLLSGDTRFATVTGRLIDFFKNKSGGDPYAIGTGYMLDGAQATGGNSAAYHGPICLGACIDSRYQSFLDTMWTWNAQHLTTGYYDGEIQLLSLVVASGNWWSPATAGTATGGSTTGGSSSGSTSGSTSQPTAQQGTTSGTSATSYDVIVNGGFTTDMSGWSNWGNAQAVAGTLQVGTAAGGAAQDIYNKLSPGKKYVLNTQASITTSAEGIFVGVKLMDASGRVLVDQAQLVSALSPTGVSISFTAPSGAASGYVYFWKNNNAAVGVIDSVSLVAVG